MQLLLFAFRYFTFVLFQDFCMNKDNFKYDQNGPSSWIFSEKNSNFFFNFLQKLKVKALKSILYKKTCILK